ncbi:MAG: molybdenum cofactor guanylyltransferase MobA [Pseudomonadota bacterium]
MTAPLGVILAGGLARRMGGGDKSLLTIGGTTLLGQVIDRLSPQVSDLALNANGDPARFARFRLPVLPDTVEDYPGPLAGVLSGMDWASDHNATHIVTAAADTPFFPADLVKRLRLAAEVDGQPIALATTENGRHPTFGYWPVALREELRQALLEGVRKVDQWTAIHGMAMADFPIQGFDPFFNVNTPEDLAKAERLMASV